ncbi:hypothetical protein NDU88_002533 [Pleurodeles waltl]|uniref:Uncharacterized protein n=1 Tax=Pleurodeles waltl TaxID=8319 RepID=A0AAV7PFI6_PLEWA|nr:hypothetical protein NDU88_002533 [Pleurodeles waltl]
MMGDTLLGLPCRGILTGAAATRPVAPWLGEGVSCCLRLPSPRPKNSHSKCPEGRTSTERPRLVFPTVTGSFREPQAAPTSWATGQLLPAAPLLLIINGHWVRFPEAVVVEKQLRVRL